MGYHITFNITTVDRIENGNPVFIKHRYAIPCFDLNDAMDVYFDIISIDGVKYARINKCLKLVKGTKILNRQSYLKEI